MPGIGLKKKRPGSFSFVRVALACPTSPPPPPPRRAQMGSSYTSHQWSGSGSARSQSYLLSRIQLRIRMVHFSPQTKKFLLKFYLKVTKFIIFTHTILENFRIWRFQPICVFIRTKIVNFSFTISSLQKEPDPKFLIFNLRIRIRN